MTVTPPESPRIFLVDGYALIYRAFYALISRPLRNKSGENTSAAWGIANFLNRLITKHQPEYLGWIHDSGLSFRHEKYPDYKATREKLTEDLQADFDTGMERICAIVEAHNIPILSLQGYEADDVIGTLVAKSVAQKMNVVVVSGDKDFQQLVQPYVWLLNPGRGGPASVEEHWIGTENGSERLGVDPQHVTDFLALVGDTSDNVPGVKGIGDKTAQALVNEFGSLENIIAAAPGLKQKRPREALAMYEAEARLSKELVTIVQDLPIDLDLDALKLKTPNYSALKDIYMELEFHTLARTASNAAVEEGSGAVAATKGESDTRSAMPEQPAASASNTTIASSTRSSVEKEYTIVTSAAMADEIVSNIRKSGSFTFDTETVIDKDSPSKIDPLRSTVVALSISVEPHKGYYFPFHHTSADVSSQGDLLAPPKETEQKEPRYSNLPSLLSSEMTALRELLEDASIKKTAQNAKYDILALLNSGVHLRGLEFDTMIASYVLDPGRRSHGLDMLALSVLDHHMTSYEEICGKGKNEIPFSAVPIEKASYYACEDTDVTIQLRTYFEEQLREHKLLDLFNKIEMPLVSVLAEMESAGISIDRERFSSLQKRFQKVRREIELKIYEEAGEEFNIASNLQLRRILFEKLNLPIIKRTATGPSTDASVLQELALMGHTIPNLLTEFRELAKLESTYLETIPKQINPRTGRIHTSFNQTVASTGRLSSSDPNLQNIPIRTELGKEIRRGFIPQKGWKMIAADYSQIELRLLAHLSKDENFVEAFNAGGDIHKQTAAIIFDSPIEDVTSDMRGRAKTINFATIYGQGPHALSQQLGISHAEAREFIDTYFIRFKGVKNYLESMVEFAREHGYVQTIFGRRRYIPEIKDRNFNTRAFGERTAANSPIQGSAADLIKIAMIKIQRRLNNEFTAKMLLQVHDELVFESPIEEVEKLKQMISEEMEGAAKLSVPLVVDIGVGDNWLDT